MININQRYHHLSSGSSQHTSPYFQNILHTLPGQFQLPPFNSQEGTACHDDDDDYNQDGPKSAWSNQSAHPAPERPSPRAGGAASARLPNPA